jgi:hypothetical protein
LGNSLSTFDIDFEKEEKKGVNLRSVEKVGKALAESKLRRGGVAALPFLMCRVSEVSALR